MAVLKGLTRNMDDEVKKKCIFESDFDSFELDDAFLKKVDADVKNSSPSQEEICNKKEGSSEEFNKLNNKENRNDNFENNAKYYDLPLFIEDFNESDIFDFTKAKPSRRVGDQNQRKGGKKNLTSSNISTSCLSPILGSKSLTKANVSSSTPLKSDDDFSSNLNSEIGLKQMGGTRKTSEFEYVEADLFEDWNLDESKFCSQKETVTLSQALQMVEDAELSAEQEERGHSQVNKGPTSDQLNKSIDLLTGEVVGAEVESLFSEPFDKLKSIEKEQGKGKKISLIDCESGRTNSSKKPPAAQKLNFDFKSSNDVNGEEKHFGKICFDSDDDFDLFAEDLFKKVKRNSKCEKHDESVSNIINKTNKTVEKLSKCDLDQSVEDIISFKKRKNYNVIDSDTTEDSPSPKFQRMNGKEKSNQKEQSLKDRVGREFLDFEAEVSDEIELSSDEVDENEEYEESFLDENSYLTQNASTDLTAKYLQSIKGFSRSGSFKIPAMKPYDPEIIFSQIPEGNNTDYQIDSFCVNDVEEEVKTDLSDLEIAEKILEIDRKEKRKKRLNKSKRVR